MTRPAAVALAVLLLGAAAPRPELRVAPGDDVQAALDRAAGLEPKPLVRFAPGVYRASRAGQALIALSARHDGLTLEGGGRAVLDGAGLVNHVLYAGDGLTERTRISGFTLTGGRPSGVRTGEFESEPNAALKRRRLLYTDGGGIKVFGDSSPVLERLVVSGNTALYCGAGISVEQMGLARRPVVLRDVRVEDNRAPATGAGLDLLPGSRAVVERAVFARNAANDESLPRGPGSESLSRAFERSSAITVFRGSSLLLVDSRVTGNDGGLDYNPDDAWYWARPSAEPGGVQLVRTALCGNRRHDLKDDGGGAVRVRRPEPCGAGPRRGPPR